MKTEIKIPIRCPSCGAKLVKNGPFLECSNPDCNEVKVHQIMKWTNTMGIMHLAKSTVNKLRANCLCADITELYHLKDNFEKIQQIDGLGSGFKRVLDEIEKAKNIPLAKFLAGFDMDGIGETIWQNIIDELEVKSLDDFFNLEYEDFVTVPGIGDTRAADIVEHLLDNHIELKGLAKVVGVVVQKKTKIVGGLTGKSFCFTGKLETMKRSEAEEMVVLKGGAIGSVKKGLTYLVTNDAHSGSSKNKKAAELGIKLIDETAFLKMARSA
jgi:DNA ligase (NAD+)